jgi:hypothetical protein
MSTKERPILFSGPMVRAIQDGRKTQTRRVMKHQPETVCGKPERPDAGWWNEKGQFWMKRSTVANFECPYGKPGDRLWVRETFYQFGHWESVPGVKTKTGRMKWRFVAHDDFVLYDAPDEFRKGRHHKDPATPAWHKRLGRFMPRWASRITLEITGVRVERVQDITETDAIAEGLTEYFWNSEAAALPHLAAEIKAGTRYWQHVIPKRSRQGSVWNKANLAFRELWNDINGPDSWDANPWVWVVEFKRLEAAQ